MSQNQNCPSDLTHSSVMKDMTRNHGTKQFSLLPDDSFSLTLNAQLNNKQLTKGTCLNSVKLPPHRGRKTNYLYVVSDLRSLFPQRRIVCLVSGAGSHRLALRQRSLCLVSLCLKCARLAFRHSRKAWRATLGRPGSTKAWIFRKKETKQGKKHFFLSSRCIVC